MARIEDPVVELEDPVSLAEERRALEEITRRKLGMSAEEFERRFIAGEFASEQNPDVMSAAMLVRHAW